MPRHKRLAEELVFYSTLDPNSPPKGPVCKSNASDYLQQANLIAGESGRVGVPMSSNTDSSYGGERLSLI